MNFFLIVLSLLSHSSQAQEAPKGLDFEVNYFNPAFYEKTIADPHIGALRRNLLAAEKRTWMNPLLNVFPQIANVGPSIYFRSDDNCTFSPNKALGVEVWSACRRHDYCYQGLADYSQTDYNKAFSKCNHLLKASVIEACTTQGKKPCSILGALYLAGVSIPGAVYKAFISDQNKQALFLSEMVRLKSPESKIYIDADQIFRLLDSFCLMHENYMNLRESSKKLYRYSKNGHDHIPKAEFLRCENFEGHRIVKSMTTLFQLN